MNTIDQRILIPASPDVIWGLVSHMENNPLWQVNCRSVSFLSTNREGQGMRYRAVNARGKEVVVEIKAWYENVGYAYEMVDGASFKSNRGTFRLQEIAEGTIVQWMFEYDLSGLLSGVRNTLNVRRSVENEIIESLESLWRVVTERTPSRQYISKSLMREAPDAEARAKYKPRHASNLAQGGDFEIDEPPFDEEDTRPRPAVVMTPSEAEVVSPIQSTEREVYSPIIEETPLKEPDFLSRFDQRDEKETEFLPSPIRADDHDVFMPPQHTEGVYESVQQSVEEAPLSPAPPLSTEQSESNAKTPPHGIPAVSPRDTATMSVFDLFGLPKPSETQQMQAVRVDEADPTKSQSIPRVELKSEGLTVSEPIGSFATPYGRVGLRLILRRRLIRVRKP